MKTILFTGGGSAGHVVPNLAIMNELRYSHRVIYMGGKGIEKGLVESAGYSYFTVEAPKLVRAFTLKNLLIPFRLSAAVKEATRIIKEQKPDLVFSKGGFQSYPAAQAAHKLKIPLITHESDLSPGLCTKIIAKKCELVLTSFPETAKLFANGLCAGSPIRKEILRGEKERALKKFGLSNQKPVLLVLGGGSGSRAINAAVRQYLPALRKSFCILHLAGKGNLMKNPPEGYIQREFENDMGSCYAAADVVLCRAGSNTVFELMALKKRAVLVPLKRGSRGDQMQNALYFERKGLVKILPESRLNTLVQTLRETLRNEELKAKLMDYDAAFGTEEILAVIRKLLQE